MEKNHEEEAAEYRELMNELNSDMDTYSSQLEINSLEISNAKSIIDSISAESKSAEDELAELMGDVKKAEHLLAQIGPSFANDYFRNMPMLDFITPSEKVIQVVIPDLH